jgi:hypothetical protein
MKTYCACLEKGVIAHWLRCEAETYSDPRNTAWAKEAASDVDAMEKAIAQLTGHLINAAVVLESGGTKKEAIRVIDDGIKIGKAMGAA